MIASQQSLARLVGVLESIREWPALDLRAVDSVEEMVRFLMGFRIALLTLFDLPHDLIFQLRQQSIETRGWRWSPRHPCHEMLVKGLSSQKVLEEIVAIEIVFVQQLFQVIGVPQLGS